jgi:hypothetical protein
MGRDDPATAGCSVGCILGRGSCQARQPDSEYISKHALGQQFGEPNALSRYRTRFVPLIDRRDFMDRAVSSDSLLRAFRLALTGDGLRPSTVSYRR